MAGKISEMSDASALDGSEQLEVVQSGDNKKVTVNDLLPVQLQGDKTIDLNGHNIAFVQGGTRSFLDLNPNPGDENSTFLAFNETGKNSGKLHFHCSDTTSEFYIYSDFNDATKLAQIEGNANSTEATLEYTADNHIFPDLVAKDFLDDTAAATGLVPVGGLYHTSGVLKIRLA